MKSGKTSIKCDGSGQKDEYKKTFLITTTFHKSAIDKALEAQQFKIA